MKRLLLSAIVALGAQVQAAQIESIDDAAATTGGEAITKAAASGAGMLYHMVLSNYRSVHPATPAVVGADDINEIVAAANKTWLNKFGLGALGGSTVTLEYDAAQVARYAGAKNVEAILAVSKSTVKLSPSEISALGDRVAVLSTAEAGVVELAERTQPVFGKAVLNMRLTDLTKELNLLKDAGAVVRKVTIKGLVPRAGGWAVGFFQVYFFGVAATDAFTAGQLYWQAGNTEAAATWKADNCQVVTLASGGTETACEKAPNFLQEMINNSVLTVVLPD